MESQLAPKNHMCSSYSMFIIKNQFLKHIVKDINIIRTIKYILLNINKIKLKNDTLNWPNTFQFPFSTIGEFGLDSNVIIAQGYIFVFFSSLNGLKS